MTTPEMIYEQFKEACKRYLDKEGEDVDKAFLFMMASMNSMVTVDDLQWAEETVRIEIENRVKGDN